VLLELSLSKREQKRIAQGTGRGLSGEFDVLYDVQRDFTGGEVLVSANDIFHIESFRDGILHLSPSFVVQRSGAEEDKGTGT